jgi:hypothetical protein
LLVTNIYAISQLKLTPMEIFERIQALKQSVVFIITEIFLGDQVFQYGKNPRFGDCLCLHHQRQI